MQNYNKHNATQVHLVIRLRVCAEDVLGEEKHYMLLQLQQTTQKG